MARLGSHGRSDEDGDDDITYPEEHIFSPCLAWQSVCSATSAGSSSSSLRAQSDLLSRTLEKLPLRPSIVQHLIYFVSPERVWVSRLTEHGRLLLRQDLSALRAHLQNDRTTSTKIGLPVSLFFGVPGSWAIHRPHMSTCEKEKEQEQLCVAHGPEEFALTARWLARYGSALRSLRVAIDLQDEEESSWCRLTDTCSGAAFFGPGVAHHSSAALLFSLMARGDLGRLSHLTLIHRGGGGSLGSSFLKPLARGDGTALGKLRVLRLSLRQARLPLRHLATLATRGGLSSLEALHFFGEAMAEDRDVADLLQALAGFHLDAVSTRRPTSSAYPSAVSAASRPGTRPGRHPLNELDLRATRAGLQTLNILATCLQEGKFAKLRRDGVLLQPPPPELAGVHARVEELLLQQPAPLD
eukprot:TRINITY_DN35879_c0_g1_i1.p1 TRINITY_DN35879_c0_g1~~TRINITY_DN35879_c0_g1_i1.p1  ORF type:complete len:412 (+),score=73.14 TRINITY_DN35879_c0_g1_i1:100-1335(+)